MPTNPLLLGIEEAGGYDAAVAAATAATGGNGEAAAVFEPASPFSAFGWV